MQEAARESGGSVCHRRALYGDEDEDMERH